VSGTVEKTKLVEKGSAERKDTFISFGGWTVKKQPEEKTGRVPGKTATGKVDKEKVANSGISRRDRGRRALKSVKTTAAKVMGGREVKNRGGKILFAGATKRGVIPAFITREQNASWNNEKGKQENYGNPARATKTRTEGNGGGRKS